MFKFNTVDHNTRVCNEILLCSNPLINSVDGILVVLLTQYELQKVLGILHYSVDLLSSVRIW